MNKEEVIKLYKAFDNLSSTQKKLNVIFALVSGRIISLYSNADASIKSIANIIKEEKERGLI